MSSIRPLATITVLAMVGVFLYMKITETKPVLPEGVDSWSIDQEIEIGNDFNVSTDIASANTPTAAPAGDTAPAFNPGAAPSAAPAFNPSESAAPASAAPTWNPDPVANEPLKPATLDDTANKPEQPVTTEVAAVPAVPPLPEIPVATNEPTNTDLANADVSGTTAETTPDPSIAVPVVNTPEIVNQPFATTPPTTQDVAVTVETTLPTTDTPTQYDPSIAIDTPAAVQAQTVDPTAVLDPTVTFDQNPATNAAQSSLYAASRLEVQAALDRGELSQALLLLSIWYDDPVLTPTEAQEVQELLNQLAGSVIYSTEPRLVKPHRVQAGEKIEDIAKIYQVPWQLLAKINGIANPGQLQAGQELKVVRGPFSAKIDISKRKLTLELDRRFAGKFDIEFDPSISIEAGHWTVNQKLLTPSTAGFNAATPGGPTEDRSLTLTNASGQSTQLAIIRGASQNSPAAEPTSRVIRLKTGDVDEVFDILSLGSKVIIRR